MLPNLVQLNHRSRAAVHGPKVIRSPVSLRMARRLKQGAANRALRAQVAGRAAAAPLPAAPVQQVLSTIAVLPLEKHQHPLPAVRCHPRSISLALQQNPILPASSPSLLATTAFISPPSSPSPPAAPCQSPQMSSATSCIHASSPSSSEVSVPPSPPVPPHLKTDPFANPYPNRHPIVQPDHPWAADVHMPLPPACRQVVPFHLRAPRASFFKQRAEPSALLEDAATSSSPLARPGAIDPTAMPGHTNLQHRTAFSHAFCTNAPISA